MKIYNIEMKIEVIANSKEEAEDCANKIMSAAYKSGEIQDYVITRVHGLNILIE